MDDSSKLSEEVKQDIGVIVERIEERQFERIRRPSSLNTKRENKIDLMGNDPRMNDVRNIIESLNKGLGFVFGELEKAEKEMEDVKKYAKKPEKRRSFIK